MLLPRTLWALALSIASVSAFKDTSPFFLFSNTHITSDHEPLAGLVRADAVYSRLDDILRSCDWQLYVLVSQPSVTPSDFVDRRLDGHSGSWKASADHRRGAIAVPEVLGQVDINEVAQRLERQCGAYIDQADNPAAFVPIGDRSKIVVRLALSPLPSNSQERASKLAENDAFVKATLNNAEDLKYIVIYTTTPVPEHPETAPHPPLHLFDNGEEFPMALHTEMKRDFEAHAKNSTVDPNLPLFEKYQYFTPGIFMAIMISVLLFSILYTGISAVAGLQVSYFAFSKEMGPAAQKKQQQ